MSLGNLSQLTEPPLSMLAGLTLNEGIVRTAILQTIINVCRSKCPLWVDSSHSLSSGERLLPSVADIQRGSSLGQLIEFSPSRLEPI